MSMADNSCSIGGPDQSQVETVSINPDQPTKDYQEAMAIAKDEAEKRLGE